MPLPCRPPRFIGCSSETVPLPLMLLSMVKPRSSSLCTAAPARRAPEPSHSIGRFAAMMRAASSSSSASEGVRGGGSGSTKLSKIAGRSTGVRCRSIGTSTLTGPVGGDSASTAARVNTPIACCAERMRYALFDTERSMPSWSGASCTVPSLAIDEFRRGLAGDVQHGRAGEARLDQSADGVRRTWSGRGENARRARRRRGRSRPPCARRRVRRAP